MDGARRPDRKSTWHVHSSEQVNKVIKRHPEIARARLVVEWIDKSDSMKLRCEGGPRRCTTCGCDRRKYS